jgi:hypothetical protein
MQLEEKKADEMLKEEKLYFDSVEEMKAHYSVSYYFSGREASREEEEHILRMHKQLEKALKS